MTPAVRRLRRLRACAALHAYGPSALVWLLDDIERHFNIGELLDERLERCAADGNLNPSLKVVATGTRREKNNEEEF